MRESAKSLSEPSCGPFTFCWYARWLQSDSQLPVAVVDVSGVLGRSMWQTDSDLEDFVVGRLLQDGWTDQTLRLKQRLTDSRFSPDIVLTNHEGDPVALIEVKGRIDEQSVRQVIGMANLMARPSSREGSDTVCQSLSPGAADRRGSPQRYRGQERRSGRPYRRNVLGSWREDPDLQRF